MAIAIDPIFSNIFFTLGLIPHISKRKNGYYSPKLDNIYRPLVSILIPLYLEPNNVIKNLSTSLINQTYDHGKMEIIFITEPEDIETNKNVESIVKDIEGKFLTVKHLITDGQKKMKPYALNYGLNQCKGEIIGIYDAECVPEKEQILKAVSSIYEQNYDIVQTKIEIDSDNLLGELYRLDMYMWYEVFLPFVNDKARAFPLGTKGLFIKKKSLEDIKGFPLHLTEDARMSISLLSQDKKFGLLESITKEESPKTWKTHFRQRRRWFRGYLSCLQDLMKANISIQRKIWLSIPYISPISSFLTLIGFSFLLLYFVGWLAFPGIWFIAPWMTTVLYDRYIFYWSLVLGYIGIPITLVSYLYAIADKSLEKKVSYVYMIPIYWTFLGISALASFFKDTKHWDKTNRET